MNRVWYVIRSDELYHHGILGQKWGVKNGPPYPIGSGNKTKMHVKANNLDKWGKDRNHNILYVTGYSGSGKSTKAREIAKSSNAEVIHLDIYLEQVGKDSFRSDSNKNFNKYLAQNGYSHDRYMDLYKQGKPAQKERWKMIDELGEHITKYGKQLYGKKKLVVEGVQLSDQTIYPDKSFFKDKPFAMMNTSAITSWYRAGVRDDKLKELDFQDAKEYINWYSSMHKNMKTLKRDLHLKRK